LGFGWRVGINPIHAWIDSISGFNPIETNEALGEISRENKKAMKKQELGSGDMDECDFIYSLSFVCPKLGYSCFTHIERLSS
jgi:hypothetical protein